MVRRTSRPEEPQIQKSLSPLQAMPLLQSRIEKANELLSKRPLQLADHTAWANTTRDVLVKSFGSDSHNISAVLHAGSGVSTYMGMPDEEWEEYYVSQLTNQIKMLESCIEQLEIESGSIGPAQKESKEDSAKQKIQILYLRFHQVVRQIRERFKDRPTLDVADEYDVQDLLHSLLRLYFEDIRTEEWTPSYAGSAARMDFLLKQEQIIIETKRTRQTLKAREVGEQLIIDIQKYQTHPDCKTLICFVYDPEGYIANPKGIENDLNRTESGIEVRVIIAPKH